MILYFSGTGNSRYIAGRLSAALNDEVLDLNQSIKAGSFPPVVTGQNVILVVPTYGWRIPRIASSWLQKTELAGAERIWFIMDCGDGIGGAAGYNRKIAQQKRLCYMGTAQIVMPENYIAVFNAPQDDEAVKIIQRAEPDILSVIASLRDGQPFSERKTGLIGIIQSGPVNRLFYRHIVKAKPFYAGDACTGCGRCASLCPLNNITLAGGKPVWGSSCTHCMACICYCPTEAIEYGRRSLGKPRYNLERLKLK